MTSFNLLMKKIRHHEFWNSNIFNVPFYSYLIFGSLLKGMNPLDIIKANPIMKNGDLRGSKYDIQKNFGLEIFPKSKFIKKNSKNKKEQILKFMKKENIQFPIIFKPDVGEVGKGVIKVSNDKELEKLTHLLKIDYLCQEFINLPLEFGVFFIRDKNKFFVSGINKKHFPKIVGNGKHTISKLAKKHERYSKNWDIFLKYHKKNKVLKKGEKLKLSFIGSHTMGCKFTDESKLITKKLEKSLDILLPKSNKFSYGRLDIKSTSEKELQKGNFRIIEINGISSLPTHMYDPDHSLLKSFKILFEHGKYLLNSASNNKLEKVEKLKLINLNKELKADLKNLNKIHQKVLKLSFK